MADTAQTHANGVASDRTEWYGGATRFELELEVHNRQFVQSLSNPYYLHHLCIQKYFDDDAFVEWCKYLKYFSEPEYLPYLSYVWLSCPVLAGKLICAS
jgi:hypothetical protein